MRTECRKRPVRDLGDGEPIGVVLAGGAARRMGGAKAGAHLAGRPLAAWVAAALGEVVGEVVLAARADTVLPSLGVPVWREPMDGPRHPLAGVASALERADGRPVLCCPVDVPFVGVGLLCALRDALPADGVAVADGQPLLGRFPPSCARSLSAAASAGARARATITALSPTIVAMGEARFLMNVNTPEDLARAEAHARAGAAASGRPPPR